MNSEPYCRKSSVRAPVKLSLASSNRGKLAEYRELASANGASLPIELELLANFSAHRKFAENEPTYAAGGWADLCR